MIQSVKLIIRETGVKLMHPEVLCSIMILEVWKYNMTQTSKANKESKMENKNNGRDGHLVWTSPLRLITRVGIILLESCALSIKTSQTNCVK